MSSSRIYAPIVIPTLNRYDYFKKCLESLEQCTGSEKTEVYVALDYPPSQYYVEGWRQIDEYLHKKEVENGFKKLHVIRRERNYGICKKDGNSEQLVKEIIKKVSDRFIFTEDDNEFSPNFLEYINWGLNVYKDDKSIYGICGCQDIITETTANNVFKLNFVFSAWGFGTWIDRFDKVQEITDHRYFRKLLKDSSITDIFSVKVFRNSSLLYQLAKKTYWGDMIVSLLPEDEKWCIFPVKNKVRNWGHDGSGAHGGSIDQIKFSTLLMDEDRHFEPIMKENLFNLKIHKMACKRFKPSTKDYFRAIINFLSYKVASRIIVHNTDGKWCKVKLLKVQ